MEDDRCEFHLFPVPERIWRTVRLDQAITATARAGAGIIAEAGGRLVPSYIGAAVRFEAWDLPWPLLRGPALAQARADVALSRVHARPDRIERRFILAAARDGTSWEATQIRGQRAPRTATYLPGTSPPVHPVPVYQALRDLNRALLSPGDPAPGR